MIGLAVLAKPLIILFLKEQWAFTATLLSIICFQLMWYPIHAINLNLLQVKGRSDLFLKLEIWKKCIGVFILSVTIPFGLVAMCVGGVVSSIICLFLNTHYTGKLIQIGFLLQLRDLIPALLYSLSMGGIVWIVAVIIQINLLKLICGMIVGVLYFYTVTKLTGSSDLRELMSFVKSTNISNT